MKNRIIVPGRWFLRVVAAMPLLAAVQSHAWVTADPMGAVKLKQIVASLRASHDRGQDKGQASNQGIDTLELLNRERFAKAVLFRLQGLAQLAAQHNLETFEFPLVSPAVLSIQKLKSDFEEQSKNPPSQAQLAKEKQTYDEKILDDTFVANKLALRYPGLQAVFVELAKQAKNELSPWLKARAIAIELQDEEILVKLQTIEMTEPVLKENLEFVTAITTKALELKERIVKAQAVSPADAVEIEKIYLKAGLSGGIRVPVEVAEKVLEAINAFNQLLFETGKILRAAKKSEVLPQALPESLGKDWDQRYY